MKYICTISEEGMEEIFIFPKTVNHNAMAAALGVMKDNPRGDWKLIIRKPISAGFVTPHGICHGESISLGMASRGDEDTELLKQQM